MKIIFSNLCAIVVLMLTTAIITSCKHQTTTIAFVIPTGFSGLILIKEDKIDGHPLYISNDVYLIDVPRTGELAVKTLSPFTQWHKTTGYYKNGKLIPYELFSGTQELGLYDLPTVIGKGCYYFVGRTEQYNFISKQADFSKYPLGTDIVLTNQEILNSNPTSQP